MTRFQTVSVAKPGTIVTRADEQSARLHDLKVRAEQA